jgi:transcriptional regulator with XRE-family HTH domain
MAKNQKQNGDPAMVAIRALFKASGLSLQDLGVRMGYEPEIARQSAWQFMKTSDPRISMIRRFAEAIDIPIEKLIGGKVN